MSESLSGSVSSIDTKFLWEELFRDPSQFWDNRNSKKTPRSPDFRHRRIRAPLWIDDWQNPPWVQEKLAGLRLKRKFRDRHSAGETDNIPRLTAEGSNALLDVIHYCGESKDLPSAKTEHLDPLQKMHAKCGTLGEAQTMFSELPVQDAVYWNALIAAYAEHGLGDEALKCFRQMQDDGISPNAVTFICVLKTCGNIGSLKMGEDIHSETSKQGLLEKNIVLGSTLVDMYAKCGELGRAQEVFDEMPIRNVVSWNALIAGYVQQGFNVEALNCFKQMHGDYIFPDVVTFTSILKACGSIQSLEVGEQIHVQARKQGLLEKDIAFGNALVDMYVKCGEMEKAQEVFDAMPVRNVITWSTLISACAQYGRSSEAWKFFRHMCNDGISPNAITFTCVLKACDNTRSLEIVEEVHAEARKQGLLEKNVVLGSTLVDVYAKYGELGKAQNVFNEMPVQDVVTWNALIAGYVQHGLSIESLNCFKQMQDNGIFPDTITFIAALKACGSTGSLETGQKIHAEVSIQGLLEKDIVLGSMVVDMYAKCGRLGKAQEVLAEMPVRDVVGWNALISGYTQFGYSVEALNCFKQMQDDGISPDAITFTCILKACSCIGSLEIGEEVCAEASKQGLFEKNIILASTLVDMYAKCGELGKAEKVFDEMPMRDSVSWNALIAGYILHGFGAEALNRFRQMQDDGIVANVVTLTCILKACGIIGSFEMGESIHVEASKQGLLEKNIMLGNALVDMYAKCGEVERGHKVYNKLPSRNVITWNALITGYGQLGQAKRALELFRKVAGEDLAPDLVTFIAVLNACSHAGFVEEGQTIFDDMDTVYYLTPTSDHYTCLMDLLCRAGCFDKAIVLLENVPSSDHLPLVLGLVGACRKWLNVEVVRWAFKRSLQLDEMYAVAFVCMGNMWHVCRS